MKRLLSSLFVSIASLGLLGCGDVSPLKLECGGVSSAGEEPLTELEVARAPVYLDGTLSMQGFVSQGRETRYARMLEALEGRLQGVWGVQPRFYRFGEVVDEETTFPSVAVASGADFYQSPNVEPGFQFNAIEKAVKHAIAHGSGGDTDYLAVIVTDLYQREADINSILLPLREALDRGLSVGVAGMRSEFDGIVYDVGQSDDNEFEFETGALEPSQHRPFFFLVVGSQDNVDRLFSALENDSIARQAGVEGAEFTIFSKQPIRQQLSLSSAAHTVQPPAEEVAGRPAQSLEPMTSTDLIVDKTRIQVDPESSEDIALFRATHRHGEVNTIDYQIDYMLPSAYAPGLKAIAVEIDPSVRRFDPVKRDFVSETPPSGAFLVEDSRISNLGSSFQLGFSLTIDTGAIEESAYQFSSTARIIDLEEESWWSEWSGTATEILSGNRGWKTYNLQPFLSRLKDISFRLAEPNIGRFCYVVQKQ